MNKVYIVMSLVESCGEKCGPDIDGVFDSKEKAIKHIVSRFGNVFFSYNSETNVYSHEPSDYMRITRWIEEWELNKGDL